LRREADFRFGLMRVRENAESIAFYRGEAQERARVDRQFGAVFSNFAKLIKTQRSLNLFQRGFSQLTLVIPSVILANGVIVETSGDHIDGATIKSMASSLNLDALEAMKRPAKS